MMGLQRKRAFGASAPAGQRRPCGLVGGPMSQRSSRNVRMLAGLADVVQKYCPIVVFHPEEEFVCCTPEWYVAQSKLVQVQGEDTKTILDNGATTVQSVTDRVGSRQGEGYRLVLGDNKAARAGQKDAALSDVPVYAHLKRITGTPTPLLEINYIFFMAYSGPYRVPPYWWGRNVGAHDGDWEHITVRCTADGDLVGVYYSAHRHGDGTWVPAQDVPVDNNTGRIVGFISKSGHGIYPETGTYPRVFYLANDVTSAAGRRWGCKTCVVMAPPGGSPGLKLENLPETADKGAELTQRYTGAMRQFGGLRGATGDAAASVGDVKVVVPTSVPDPVWMMWDVRWGTVVKPHQQEWFARAEHPTGSNSFNRTVLPWQRQ